MRFLAVPAAAITIPVAVGSVPAIRFHAVHLDSHVIFLRQLLLNSECPVALILLFTADVSDAFTLFFEHVEGFSLVGCALNPSVRECCINFLLHGRLWSFYMKSSSGQQRLGVVRFHLGTASETEEQTG